MGNTSKKPEDFDVVSSYHPEEWFREEKRNGFQVWVNNHTKARADAYPSHSSLKSNDLENYQLRRNNSSNIVKVHHVGFEKNQNLCSKSSQAVILTQRIPLRLDGVFNLSESEALCVLRSAYNGFNTLGSFYGPIEPYEDMICFNEEGRPKVWLNSNLSLNQPEEKRQDKNKKDLSERNQIYVGKILDMVENKTTGFRQSETIVDKFRHIGPKNYFEAINILQQYAAEMRMQIPETIDMPSRRSMKGSRVDPYQSNVNITQLNTSKPLTFRANVQQSSFNARHTTNAPLNFNQNIPPYQSQAPSGRFVERNNYNSVYSVCQSPRVDVRNKQVNFNSQPFQQNHFHQNNQPPMYFTNTASHQLVSSQHNHNRSNIVLERSRSGQLNHFQVHNRSHIPPPPVVKTPPPIQYRPVQPAQLIAKFDSPSKVVFNETIQYNRFPQAPASPQRISNQRIKTEEEISNSSPNHDSPTKLGHVRKQNSQEFVAFIQPRVDPQLPEYISIAEAKRAQLEEQQKRLQTQELMGSQKSLHRVTESGNLIQDSQEDPTYQNEQEEEDQPQVERNYESHLSSNEQKYIDNLEEQQARQEDELQENPDAQYADYIRKQKIRQEEEEIMRDQKERYENDHGHSSNEDQQADEEMAEDHETEQITDQQDHFQTRNEYLMRKNTDENELEEVEQNIGWNEKEARQNVQINDERQEEYAPQSEYLEFVKQNNESLKKNTTQSLVEDNNELIKEFGESQLQNATSQEYFCEVQNNSSARNERNEAILHKNANIQRVVSMEKKFTESSLGGSGNIHKVDDKEIQADFEQKRVQPIQVQSQYLRGTEKSYQRNSLDQIPEDARYEDIEAYIKQKYSSYLRDDNTSKAVYQPKRHGFGSGQFQNEQNNEEQDYDVRKMAWYVESKYDQMKSSKTAQEIAAREQTNKRGSFHSKENLEEERISDMLDVKNMERSLDKKYSSMKSQPKIEDQRQDQNQFDIKKLEENLIRFEQSRVGGGQAQNSSQSPNFETSQVSKIENLENRGDRRKSSISREINFKQQNSYTYIVEKDYRKPSSNYSGTSKQRDSFMNYASSNNYAPPISKKYERNSKISNFLGSIDEKFNKYVVNNSSKNSQRYSPRIASDVYSKKSSYEDNKKSYEPSYRHLEVENENNYISSRLATAKFEYAQSEEGKKNVLEPKLNSNKDLTYEQLRKYMWS